MGIVAALTNERQGLNRVDLLDAFEEVGAGVAVLGVLVDADRDRLHDLGDLVEGHQRHLDEVVDRHATQERLDGRDLCLAPRVTFLLLSLGAVQAADRGKEAGLLVESQPVRLLDLSVALTVRATSQVDAVSYTHLTLPTKR